MHRVPADLDLSTGGMDWTRARHQHAGGNDPTEQEIKVVLLRELTEELSVEHEFLLIRELGLRRHIARADVVAVNGSLHGYEIKSNRDSLRRLRQQAKIYSEVFDSVTIVIGSRHARFVRSLIPTWWGIKEVISSHGLLTLECRRVARINPKKSAGALVELLWREECLELLEGKGQSRGLRSRPRRLLWDRVCEVMTVEEISTAVRSCLIRRAAQKSAQ